MLDQSKTPLFDALKKYAQEGTVPFHVPGHKGGRGIPELTEYLGANTMTIDINSIHGLDDLNNPSACIQESHELAADLFGSDYAHFLVNGTSQGVQSMIMSTVGPDDRIIIPRNAHKSAINGLILSGARPIYIKPEVDSDLGIALNLSMKNVTDCMNKVSDLNSILLLNSTYYGICADVNSIVKIAHEKGIAVLADEAHGATFSFHPELPMAAMAAGADMSALSTHKSLGSLTQSSILLYNEGLVKPGTVKGVIGLSQTTSSSYLLMLSLELCRKQMGLTGEDLVERALELSHYARKEINQMNGLFCFGAEHIAHHREFSFDPMKLYIDATQLGLTGFQLDLLLRYEYNLQVEMATAAGVMALVTVGDNKETIEALLFSLKEISQRYQKVKVERTPYESPDFPDMFITPREAYYATSQSIPLEEAQGEISTEMIMVYPPGIPLVCPGEIITQDMIDHIAWLKAQNSHLQGTEDPTVSRIRVVDNLLW